MAKRKKKAEPEPEPPKLSVMDRVLAQMEAGTPLWHYHPCPHCKQDWRCGDVENQCDPVCPFCGQEVKNLKLTYESDKQNRVADGRPPENTAAMRGDGVRRRGKT